MRHGRVDGNQQDIINDLEDVPGITITRLTDVGLGVPDLLLGFRGVNYLLEVKNENNPPSKRKLTPDQEVWHREWTGQVSVIMNTNEAFEVIGL